MNNNPNDKWPDVPDPVAEWLFYDTLRDCNVDFGRTNAIKDSHRCSRRHLLVQLKLMSNTRCIACSGYAHRARDCPTNARLGML